MFTLSKIVGLIRPEDHRNRCDARSTENKHRAKEYAGVLDLTDERTCLIGDPTDGCSGRDARNKTTCERVKLDDGDLDSECPTYAQNDGCPLDVMTCQCVLTDTSLDSKCPLYALDRECLAFDQGKRCSRDVVMCSRYVVTEGGADSGCSASNVPVCPWNRNCVPLIVFAVPLGLAFAYEPTHYQGHGNTGDDNHADDYHYDPHTASSAPYHFEYGVKDPHTYNVKSQHEVSNEHSNVKGSYSLVEPDGSMRVVEYTADHEHGFNAVIKKIGGAAADHDHDHGDQYNYDQGQSLLHPSKLSSYYKSY